MNPRLDIAGGVFFCMGCQHFRHITEGHMTLILQTAGPFTNMATFSLAPSPLLLCWQCLPVGADAQPLTEVISEGQIG